MDPIQFNSLPTPLYVPGQYGEFDNSQANGDAPNTIPQKILLVGQKLAAGSAANGAIVRVFSADQVGDLAGRGSMLHQMAKASFAANPYTPTYILPLADGGGATKSARKLTITGPSTEAGELALYIGDTRYSVAVALGATATTIAASIVTAIAADDDRYVDAAVNGVNAYEVDLAARSGGIEAGRVGVAINRYDDEALPAGVGLAIGALTDGTVNPNLATGITAMGDTWYPTIVCNYGDTTNQGLLRAELESRFGPVRHIDGYAHCALNDTVNNQIAFAEARNSPWLSLTDASDCLSPAFVVAAAVAARDAGEPHPGRPRQTLTLPGILSKRDVARRTFTERNQLIGAGVSTLSVDEDGTVRIERLTTTYRTNAYGVEDKSYFDTESMHLLAQIRYDWRAFWAQKYPRHMLGDDGSVGDLVATPSLAKDEVIARYRSTWMPASWVEGGAKFETFKENVRAQRPADDPNRLDMLVPPDLINGLRVLAASFQFRR